MSGLSLEFTVALRLERLAAWLDVTFAHRGRFEHPERIAKMDLKATKQVTNLFQHAARLGDKEAVKYEEQRQDREWEKQGVIKKEYFEAEKKKWDEDRMTHEQERKTWEAERRKLVSMLPAHKGVNKQLVQRSSSKADTSEPVIKSKSVQSTTTKQELRPFGLRSRPPKKVETDSHRVKKPQAKKSATAKVDPLKFAALQQEVAQVEADQSASGEIEKTTSTKAITIAGALAFRGKPKPKVKDTEIAHMKQ